MGNGENNVCLSWGRGGKTQILEINVLKIQNIMCPNIDPLLEKLSA